jgi:hypothetical protein
MTFDLNHNEKCGKSARGYLEDRQTIHNVCVIFGLSYGTCQQILSDDLNMWRIAVCTELKEQAEETPTLSPSSLLVTNLGVWAGP